MRSLVEPLKPILAAGLAVLLAHCSTGCQMPKPPGAAEMEQAYQAELLACVQTAQTARESCECRQAVDEHWGVCDHPSWPQMGRCDFRCEQF